MNSISAVLRRGVSQIISHHSPVCCPEEADRFCSSSHIEREICFVLSGTSRYMINRNVYDISPGTCIFIDRWVPHAFGYAPEDHDLLHLWIHFSNPNSPNGIIQKVKSGGIFSPTEKFLRLPAGYTDVLMHRLGLLKRESSIDETVVDTFLRDPINSILAEFAFQMEHQTSAKEKTKDHIKAVVQAVKTHILMCNARNCSYRTLEQISGFSRSYLAHCFRHHTGMSIGDFIDQVRIDYSAKARQRGLKQKEIAYELGFSSPVNYWIWLQKHKDRI